MYSTILVIGIGDVGKISSDKNGHGMLNGNHL